MRARCSIALLLCQALGETRRINVYLPPGLHVAGLVQVSVGNGTMRP